MRSRVTAADLARDMGLPYYIVLRALGRDQGYATNPETTKAVLARAQEMGYRPPPKIPARD